MGQQCAKENQVKSSPNAPVAEIDFKQSKGNSSLQAAYRPYFSHPSVEELLSRLSQSQLLLFLDQFKSKCQSERRLLLQYGSDKKVSKALKKSWKRLSLKDVTLVTMFESLQQVNYANYIKDTVCSSQSLSGDNSTKLHAWIDDLSLLEDPSLLKAFHIVHYLFNLEGIENNIVRDEVIFQDFAAALSICLNGSREEMLIFMFLLFADTTDPLPGKSAEKDNKKYGMFSSSSKPSSRADTSVSKISGRGRSLTDPETAIAVAGKSNVNIVPDAPPTGNSPETRTRRSTFDNLAAGGGVPSVSGAGAASSVSGAKSNVSHSRSSGKHSSADSGGNPLPLLHSTNRLLSRLMLSEPALYKFMLFYLLCFQNSSYLRDNRSTDFLGDEPSALPVDGFSEVIVDLLTKLSQTKNPSAATALSFKSFLTLMHDAPMSAADDTSSSSNNPNNNSGTPVGFVASGLAALTLAKLIRPSGKGIFLNTSTEGMRRVLYVLVNDIVKNPYKIMQSALDCFDSDPSQVKLPSTLNLFGINNTKPVVNKSLPDHQVFLMDAGWFFSWCECMELVPLFGGKWAPTLGSLLMELNPKAVYTSENGTESPVPQSMQYKFRRVGAFDEPPSGLMRLKNVKIMEKNHLGLLEVRRADSEGTFVALPYAMGAMLYNYYDSQASVIPAQTYQRRLNFCSSTVPPQEILQQPIKKGVESFVNNFYAVNSSFIDSHPLMVPVFYCNASGLANPKNSDLLKVFHNPHSLSVLNADAPSRMTIRDLISAQLLSNRIHSIKLSDVRLWGLYRTDPVKLTITPSPVVDILCHSVDCEWRLLSKTDSDYDKDLFVLFGARQSVGVNGVDSRDKLAHHCIGVMLEVRNEAQVWPTARVTPIAYSKYRTTNINSTIVTSSSHIELSTSGSEAKLNLASANDIYRIGQLVDVLSDSNTYCNGEVIAIAKDVAADFTTRMLVTIRLVNADLAVNGASSVVKSILKVKAATPVAAANGTVPNDVVILPYYSPRVLPPGSVTGLQNAQSDQSTLSHALTLLTPLIALTDTYARQANLLKGQQSVGTSRSIITLKRKTSVGVVKNDFALVSINPAMVSTQKTTANEDDEEEEEARNIENFQVPDYELSKDNSKTSLQSGRSNEGIKTPNSNGTAATTKNVGLMFGNKSGTVIPLPYNEEPAPILSPSSVDAAAGLGVTAATETESVDTTPLSTVSADAGLLFTILAKEGQRCPSFVRLLYTLVKNESRLINTASSDIRAVDLDPEVFALPDKPTAYRSLLSLEPNDDVESVASNDLVPANDANRSVTDGTDNTDASALNGVNGGLKDKRGPKSFGPKNIAKACNSITKMLSGGKGRIDGKNGAPRNGAAYTKASDNNSSGVELSNANARGKSPMSVGGGDYAGVCTTIGLTGLNNCGNTCFLSSALQCLTKTPLFVLYFLTQQYQFDLNTTNNLGSKGKLTKEFARFLFTIYNLNATGPSDGAMSIFGTKTSKAKLNHNAPKYDSMSPIALIKSFQAHKPYFTGADQQDAQEFLSELLDTFHEDLKLKAPAAPPVPKLSEPTTVSTSLTDGAASVDSMSGTELNIDKILQQGKLAWEKYVSNNNSIISSMFQGQLCNKVTCKVCNTVSVKFEPFTTLSLSIPKMQGPNSNGFAENLTIVTTFYRKVPRLLLMQKYIALCRSTKGDEDGGDGVIDMNSLKKYLMLCRKPVRIAVTVSRHGTMYDIKQKVCEALNAIDHPMTPEEEANHFNNNSSTKDGDEASLDLSRLPLLNPLNITAVDVNGEERGKIRKIVENKEPIHSFVDDVQSDFSIIMLENNKNIPFISQLPAARLMPTGGKTKKTLIDPSKDWKPLVLEYTDEMEYSVTHAMHNNDPNFEGRLLGDIDYIYDKDTITTCHPLFIQAKTPVNAASASAVTSAAASTNGALPRKNSVSSLDSAASRTGVKYNNSLSWPSTVDQFVVGTRVDALDHKGCWFSGSIIDVFDVTEADIKSAGLTKHARDSKGNGAKPPSSTAASNQPPRQKLHPGVHVRVHFDSFSSIWDEWFDQKDYEAGFIFPVYVKTQRKLKIFDIQVIQRRLVPDKAGDMSGEENQMNPDASRVIDVFDMPIILQSESYRSINHVHQVICEQMVRFMSEEQIAKLIQCQESGQEFKWPFNVRILSSNNILAPPLDPNGSSDDDNECRKRFFDFKLWEGSAFPLDKNRPLVNLFHSRIIISVDWFNAVEDKFPVIKMEDQSCMLFVKRSLYPHDLDSFLKYIQHVQQKQQQLMAAQVHSPTNADIAIVEPNQPFKDTRVGLTIEHLLSKFVGVEEIEEYFCDCCRKLCPGIVHSSIHMLPDVLMLHLKRLVMNATGGGKIRTLVKFPLLDLNMSPYITENMNSVSELNADHDHIASQATLPSVPSVASIDTVSGAVNSLDHHYELYGVVNHLGGMYGGHYVAMAKCEQIVVPSPSSSAASNGGTGAAPSPMTVREDVDETSDNGEGRNANGSNYRNGGQRTPVTFQDYLYAHGGGHVDPAPTKKWLKFDDEFVLEVSNTSNNVPIETSICTESAYLLFYQKKVLSNKNLLKYL